MCGDGLVLEIWHHMLSSEQIAKWMCCAAARSQLACQLVVCECARLAVERRQCRLALAGGNGGDLCLLLLSDLSKAAIARVPAAKVASSILQSLQETAVHCESWRDCLDDRQKPRK